MHFQLACTFIMLSLIVHSPHSAFIQITLLYSDYFELCFNGKNELSEIIQILIKTTMIKSIKPDL